MRELITFEAFSRVMIVLAVGGLAAGVLAASWQAIRRRGARAAVIGLAWGLLGPVAWLGWRGFLWATYPRPDSLYVGLHHPSRLAAILVVFVAAGAVVGIGVRRFRNTPPGESG
jgi:hypothetical protein